MSKGIVSCPKCFGSGKDTLTGILCSHCDGSGRSSHATDYTGFEEGLQWEFDRAWERYNERKKDHDL
jgi:DnaJ-class molecular chaperone